jgi:hypothetical protein
MTTVNDLISRSMRALQALGDNEVPTASEYNDGRVAFNSMLESFSLDGLSSYVMQEQSFSLVVGTNSYTIGSGGVVNVTRPTEITQAYIRDSLNNDFLMNLHTRDTWNQIGNRGSNITSQIPTDLFYDPQNPLGVINIFPTPSEANTCFFDSTLQLTTFPSATTQLAMPIGYERMYVYNLAVELASMFGFPIPPVQPGQKNVTVLAMESLEKVKRMNMQSKPMIANYDPYIVTRSDQTYNIYRGEG